MRRRLPDVVLGIIPGSGATTLRARKSTSANTSCATCRPIRRTPGGSCHAVDLTATANVRRDGRVSNRTVATKPGRVPSTRAGARSTSVGFILRESSTSKDNRPNGYPEPSPGKSMARLPLPRNHRPEFVGRQDALAYLWTKSSSPNVLVCCKPSASRPKNVQCRGVVCGPLIILTVSRRRVGRVVPMMSPTRICDG